MKSDDESGFVETLEFRRFAEFCDACSHYRYIGLCCGPAGIGKTRSARRFADWDRLGDLKLNTLTNDEVAQLGRPSVAFITVPVSNTPRSIEGKISEACKHLEFIAREPLQRRANEVFTPRSILLAGRVRA